MQTLSETDVRRIIREELAAILGTGLRRAPRAPVPRFDPAEDVARFAATLAPGERVPAAAFYGRWKAWAEVEAPGAAPMTMTAFGRAAARCGGLVRGAALGRRFYVRKG